MSKNNIWAVLNVSEEAKNEAKRRAKLEKKPIGEWLSHHIIGKESFYDNMGEKNKDDDLTLLVSITDTISTEIDELKLGMKAIYNKLEEFKPGKYVVTKRSFFGKFLG